MSTHRGSFFLSPAPTEYTYLSSLNDWNGQLGPRIYARAQSRLNYSSITGGLVRGHNSPAVANLRRMISLARAQEQRYLQNHNLGNPGNDWKKLIEGFNQILGKKEIYERNMNLIKQVAQGTRKGKTFQDITKFMDTYIEKAGKEYFESVNLARIRLSNPIHAENVLKLAFEKMANATDWVVDDQGRIETRLSNKAKETAQAIQAFQEIARVISSIQNNPMFKKMIEALKLNDYLTQLRQAMLKKNTKKTKKNGLPKITSKGNKGNFDGTAAEYVLALFAGEMGGYSSNNGSISFVTSARGFSDVKTDVMMIETQAGFTVADVTEGLNSDGEYRSKEANIMANMNEMWSNLQNAQGEIVQISAKNYTINPDFENTYHGFSAQTVTIRNLESMLIEGGAGFNITSLVDFLSNCGDDLILGHKHNEILDTLATTIGHFLFNDLNVDIPLPGGINNVHVFAFGLTLMPLSVYLEAILFAIEDLASGDLSSLIHIDFDTEAPTRRKYEGGNWEDYWEEYREQNLDRELHIRFLQNFAKFITSAAGF